MFNLLGSIFGYGSQPIKPESQPATDTGDEALTQTECRVTASQATQTLDGSAKTLQSASPKTVVQTSAPGGADWVIVDRNEEAEKCNVERTDAATSTSMIKSKHESSTAASQQPTASSIAESVMLGSFFEKNSHEDEDFNRKYKKIDEEDMMMMQTTTKDWLITPLPCLTSITASQRSIENDPLENLLIEHPSMSVFVAATSSSSSSDDSFAEDEDMHVDEPKKTAFKEVEKNVAVLTKSVSEKRKVTTSPAPSSANVSASGETTSPIAVKRKGKKNKKSAGTSPATVSASSSTGNVSAQVNKPHQQNKENMTVLTAADFKKQSNTARLESLLLNKNQMKRANKNSVFSSAGAKNANVKHRKYHKLQQPAFMSSKPVF